MEEKIRFEKRKLSVSTKISDKLISETNLKIGTEANDIVSNLLTVKLDAYFYSHMADKQILEYYCHASSFLDWLFKRKKMVRWELRVHDILLNPPKLSRKTKRSYIFINITK